MLEPIILDNTERLLSASGKLSELSNCNSLVSGTSQMVCLGRDSKAAYPYSSLANMCAPSTPPTFASWLSAVNNVLLLAENVSPYNVMAVNLTTGAMSQDSTNAQIDGISEDASGVIWANAINTSYFGLWKRTGEAAWTKLLADTAAGYLRRFSDNTLYYVSSAGNWYTLNNGAATVSANPLGYDWHTRTGNGRATNDNVCAYSMTYTPGYVPGLGNLPATPGYYSSAAEQTSARYWPANAAAQTTGTAVLPIGNLNWEMLQECTRPNAIAGTYSGNTDIQGDSGALAHHKFFRLDDTYMLHTVAVGGLYGTPTASLTPGAGSRKIVITILNKTTGANKYIGSIHLTASSTVGGTAAYAAQMYGCIVGAKLTSGVLDLWIAQGTHTTGSASDFYGLFKKSLTLNLDF